MTKPHAAARRNPTRARRSRHAAGLEQLRALSHPLRLRLFELFSERPRTTMQAARRLGGSPTRLYHHVAALERAGLVRLRETRPNRGATEKYFEAVAHQLEPGRRSRGLAGAMTPRDVAAVALIVFDQARNELLRGMASPRRAKPAALMAIRGVLRLSPSRAQKMRKELTVMLRRLHRAAAGGRARRSPSRRPLGRYSLTIALLPLDADNDESQPD